ncbi:MAG: hypothetical protein IIA63_05885 [Nitrospinae bacterium]|nr:hypothetical protein [Nitrospinota bacterium]
MTPDQKMVKKLVLDEDVQEWGSRLIEEGFNADHLSQAFMLWDAYMAGEIGSIENQFPEAG